MILSQCWQFVLFNFNRVVQLKIGNKNQNIQHKQYQNITFSQWWRFPPFFSCVHFFRKKTYATQSTLFYKASGIVPKSCLFIFFSLPFSFHPQLPREKGNSQSELCRCALLTFKKNLWNNVAQQKLQWELNYLVVKRRFLSSYPLLLLL